jgi:putative transcriptional regulator
MATTSKQGTIRNRLRVVLAEKETRDGRRYTYREIEDLTGVSTSTLTDWAKGRVKQYAVVTLAALCQFLECVPADLLEYVPPTSAE